MGDTEWVKGHLAPFRFPAEKQDQECRMETTVPHLF